MSNNSNESLSQLTGTSVVTREMIEAAIQRGRRERSQAFWTMLQTVFSRPEAVEDRHSGREVDDRNISLAR
jgi:hypothetical protein